MRRTLMLGLGTLLLWGCGVPRPTAPIYKDAGPVTLGFVVDDAAQRQTLPVPEALVTAVNEVLTARTLKVNAIDLAVLATRYATVRDSQRRLRDLGERAKQGTVVLVEAQAMFYSHLAGRYRWTVRAQISVGKIGELDRALVRAVELPIVLDFAHEKGDEALRRAAPELARRVGELVDDELQGRGGDPVNFSEAARVSDAPDAVYFVLVDRFQDGAPNRQPVDPKDPAAWHGGDLAGVTARLDALQDLGVRTIWLSPINRSRYADFMGHGAFHGYWVWDINAIDPRFGDGAALKALVNGAHARGMRVLLDLVVNHVGYGAPALKTHPEWFHTEGTIEDWGDATQVVRREVHGLPDLAQEHPEVYTHLLQAADRWLTDYDVDGFRLDAVKHVSLVFWGRFTADLKAKHGADLTLLAEHYDGDPTKVDHVRREGGFSHMFDFPMAFALREVFCKGRTPQRLAAVLGADRLYDDPNRLVTFLDNHDLPRIRTECGGDLALVRHALTAQMALRGVPALNYGTEVGLKGGEEPYNRGDMVFDPAPGDDLRGHIKALLALRAAHPALAAGQTQVLVSEPGLLVFSRAGEGESALVIISADARDYVIPAAFKGATDALSGAPVGQTLRLGAGRTTTVLLASSPLPTTQRGPLTIQIKASRKHLKPGETLYLVGSGPELGQWRPKQGVPLTSDGATSTLTLPAGVVFGYKLVARGPNGDRWATGPDQYLSTLDGAPNELTFTFPKEP